MATRYVVTGIGTGVGKTVVSAIIAEALNAYYWKPIQAGDLDQSDSITVKSLTSNVNILPEAFRLNTPLSPHASARLDQVSITQDDLFIPDHSGNLVIEGAGGINVPINDNGFLFSDLIKLWALPVIVVSRHYLGSINHTLLTIEVLRNRTIPLKGVIFIGDENLETEEVILNISKAPSLGRIPLVDDMDKRFIGTQAELFRELL